MTTTLNPVLVVVRFISSRIRSLFGAVGERFVVFDAEKWQEDFATSIPVTVGNMATCRHCKNDKHHRGDAELVVLPPEVTQNKLFRKKSAPVRICPVCDGGALEQALYSYHKKTDRSK